MATQDEYRAKAREALEKLQQQIDELKVQANLAGQRDHTLRLWQLLVFELWHRQYLDATVSAPDAHVV